MSTAAVSFKLEGVSHLTDRLASIKGSLRDKYLRRGVTSASRRVNKAAKAKLATAKTSAKKRKEQNLIAGITGLLRKSMGIKIKNYGGGSIIGIIGPAQGFRAQIGVRIRGGKKSKPGDPIYHDPAKIAHLVEFGHGGPHPAGPHAFMRDSFESSKSGCVDDIRGALESGLVKELK